MSAQMMKQFNQLCTLLPNYIDQVIQPEINIGIIGLSSSGKSTMKLNLLRQNKKDQQYYDEQAVPTIGIDIEKFVFKNQKYSSWELGGKCNNYEKMKNFIPKTKALILVIDGSNYNKIHELKAYFEEFIQADSFHRIPVLIFLNHEDIDQQKIKSYFVEKFLDLERFSEQENEKRQWFIQNCNGQSGEGVREGFLWLHGLRKTMNRKQK